MRVVIDAFGGDNAPLEIVKGAALASNEFGCDITLTGDEAKINAVIKENNLRLAMQPNVKIEKFEDGKDIKFDITAEL